MCCNEEFLKKLLGQIQELPDGAQEAMNWLIKNQETINHFLKKDPIPEERIEEYTQNAKRRKDYFMLVLLA